MYQPQRPPRQRTRNGSPADLLPVSARLLVAHQKILIIDPRKVKRQNQATHLASPHQTGVTERSIGGGDGNAVHHVVNDVMVGDTSDGVCTGRFPGRDRDHFLVAIQLRIARRPEGCLRYRVEHLLIDIHPRKTCKQDRHSRKGDHAHLSPRARRYSNRHPRGHQLHDSPEIA